MRIITADRAKIFGHPVRKIFFKALYTGFVNNAEEFGNRKVEGGIGDGGGRW